MHPMRTINAVVFSVFTLASITQAQAAADAVKTETANVTVFEFFNTTLKHYFRTAVVAEANAIDAGAAGPGWQRTGLNFTASGPGSGSGNDVCRFYNPVANTHFYTADPDECAQVKKDPGWRYEELSFRIQLPVGGICPAGTKPVYRTYNDRFAFNDSNHRFMTTLATYNDMIAQTWRGEGIVMCALNDGTLSDVTAAAGSTLSGTVNVNNLTIPAGVTVNVTGNLALNAAGAVNIAGMLTGDCKTIAIVASGRLDVAGTINNQCSNAGDADPPSLTLVGYGGYRYNGNGTVTTSGDLLVTNNASLPRTAVAGDQPSMLQVGGAVPLKALGIDYDCESNGREWTKAPARSQDGRDGGVKGDPGKKGKQRTLSCAGNGLVNNSSVFGQDGGNGGLGTDARNVDTRAEGGVGGIGGELLVHVTGQLDFAGTNVLNGGNGGPGGIATATALANAAGGSAPSATAIGARGGDSGTITVRAGAGITVSGTLALNVGQGGSGGNGTATGAEGANSTAVKPAQIGGFANSTGGDGGQSPSLQLTANGAVPGLANVIVTGGNGGNAGHSDSTGGKGGDGVVLPNIDGGDGGAVIARGGKGGDAGVRNLAGALVGTGGIGGNATFRRGLGGLGYNDCAPPLTKGGNGGAGGMALGGSRGGGSGLTPGAGGLTREIIVGNGGNGGHGLGPGDGGLAGNNGIVGVGAPNITPPVFTPGAKGRGCRFTIIVTVASDPTPPHEGFVGYTAITIIDALVDNRTNIIAFTGLAGGKWIAVSGPFNPVTGAFNASGAGTAAGIANVPATFVGTINLATGQITGVVTLIGTASTPPNGLPGHSVSYNVTGNVIGVTPP